MKDTALTGIHRELGAWVSSGYVDPRQLNLYSG